MSSEVTFVKLTWPWVYHHLVVISFHPTGKESVSLRCLAPRRENAVCVSLGRIARLQDFVSPHLGWAGNLDGILRRDVMISVHFVEKLSSGVRSVYIYSLKPLVMAWFCHHVTGGHIVRICATNVLSDSFSHGDTICGNTKTGLELNFLGYMIMLF